MKKLKQLLILFFVFAASSNVFGQGSESVEMADVMRSEGKIYVVLGVVLLILVGLFTYLIILDRKIGKLEKEQK